MSNEVTFEDLPGMVAALTQKVDSLNEAIANMRPKEETPVQDGYLKVSQVCKRLHITKPTFYRLVKDGRLTLLHVGGRSLVKESEVMHAVKPVSCDLENKKEVSRHE